MTGPMPSPDTPNAPINPVVTADQVTSSVEAAHGDEVRSLAAALVQEDQQFALVLKGVVVGVQLTGSPPTISLNLSGDTTSVISAVRFIDSYSPVVGDTVLLVKQGSELFALGQMNSTTTAPSENGWVTPTLGSNVTAHGIDPVRYRVVVRDGDRVVQLRGGVNIASSATALWTMPSDVRPVVNLLPLLVARNSDTGSNVAQLQVNADGTMVLVGATTGVRSVGSTTGSTGNDDETSGALPDSITDSATVNIYHDHDWLNTDPNGGNPDAYRQNSNQGPDHITGTGHTHGMGHFHTFIHNHTVTSTAVSHPTWLSFNGVEYVL